MSDNKMRILCGTILAAAMLAAHGEVGAEAVAEDAKPLKVLAIGNSFSIGMHAALPPVAKSFGRRVDICTMYIGGCSLERHCKNLAKPESAPYQINWTWGGRLSNPNVPFAGVLSEIVDAKTGRVRKMSNIPQMLRAEKWDVVTIQQASHESWKGETYYPFGDELVKAIRDGAPQAKIVVQETWSYVSFCPRFAKWGIDQTEMYDRLHKCYGDFAAKYGFDVIPVGTAVQLYRRRLPVRSTDTDVGGDPVGKSPKGDSIHMNADGEYLQSLVWAGTLLGVDVEKCTYAPRNVGKEKAAVMRECAARAVAASTANADMPCVSGVYPHLAMFNDEGECGTGAVVPWAGDLWVITYGPHCPVGSTDKLYRIKPDLSRETFAGSVGGTPANRLVHRETDQLLIGPYVIDARGNVRVVPPAKMPGRLTGAARHLDDPGKVYVATMETGLYELDMRTLEVNTLVRENGKNDKAISRYLEQLGMPLPNGWDSAPVTHVPGYHGKGLCSGFGRVFVANNGEDSPAARRDPFVPSGVLAWWNERGRDWTTIRRCQFTEITTPDGIYGNEHPRTNPVWALGWDAKSVILGVTTNGTEWAYYRLPKASHAYDGAHGWNTEWPRIRDVGFGDGTFLATMHGTFWKFPKGFSPASPNGLRPISTYLKVIGDFCRWGDRIVFGCDDQAKNEFLGKRGLKKDAVRCEKSQSNLWFVKPEDLRSFGPPSGEGYVWLDEDVKAGDISDPYLHAGYETMEFSFTSADGAPVRHELLEDGDWVRVKCLEDAKGAVARFAYGPARCEIPKLDGKSPVVTVTDDNGKAWRFPNVNGDTNVICREIATERDLLYVGGVWYEVPADNAGGFSAMRPIALADEPVRALEGRLGLMYVNGRAMVIDDLWKNGTASAAYWLWRQCAADASQVTAAPSHRELLDMVCDPAAFAVGALPPRSLSWPSKRLAITDGEWLFDIDDWRMDISRGWRMTWRPEADFPAELDGFESVGFDDSGWTGIDLPATFEAMGFGTPMYRNCNWTFPPNPPFVPTVRPGLADAAGRTFDFSVPPGTPADAAKETVKAEPNPTARLRRRFDLPQDWVGRETRIWLGSAQSAVAVWCNGSFVGFAQGCADAHEFDLTPFVRPAGNVLALQVFKYCSGIYLEDQDVWRTSGINREVFLYSVAPSHIEDVRLAADYSSRSVAVDVSIEKSPEGGSVEVDVAGKFRTSAPAAPKVRFEVPVPGVPDWTPESPHLLPVRIVLRGADGGIADIRHFRIGMRSSAVVDGVYHMNGIAFKFQGVNRHEIDPVRYRVVTRESMLRDARLVKDANFNAVRCCHYTQHPLWYEICDRVGLAVMAEANIESHGLSYHKCVLPGDLAEWLGPVLDRTKRMVYAAGNHPSVVLWSLGNEAGWGSAFEKSADLVRCLDGEARPIQYADMNAPADFDSQTYPTAKWLREWLDGKAKRKGERGEAAALRQHGPQPSGKPYVANEYAHAMGNSTGGFGEIWDVFESSPRFAGGFLWEWCEHGLSAIDAAGRFRSAALRDPRAWLRGGDFGETPTSGNFCTDGLVRPNRAANPGLEEVRFVQQPIAARLLRDGGGVGVRNRLFFTALELPRHTMRWTLLEDGAEKSSGEWRDFRIAPGATAEFPLPDMPSASKPNAERILRVALLVDGAKAAECEIALGAVECGCDGPGAAEAILHPLAEAKWEAVFDRVPTDNDIGRKFDKPADAKGEVECEALPSGAKSVVLRFSARGEHGREGVRCVLPRSAVASVSWYGRGPHENYPDRCRSSLLGVWRTGDPERDLATPYSRPQENGERCGVRWLEITAADGARVRIVGERPFAFALRPYTSQALASAHYHVELPPYSGRPDCWELTLDAAVAGVGGDNSWGAAPIDAFRLMDATGTFKWTLLPEAPTGWSE